MRFTLIMRNAPKAADPWKTHTGDTSPLWKRVREALVVNPDSTSGNPMPREFRQPEPGGREEKFTVPASRASDIAQNQYFNRDFRRNYPKTEVLSQPELATLLIAQGEMFTALPQIQSTESDKNKALTADSQPPSLASLFSTSTAVAAPSFKPPVPPSHKYEWRVSAEPIEDANPDFPMENYSSFRKS